MGIKTIRRQVTSVVTDIRVDRGRLILHAIDQDKAGAVMASHDMDAGPGDLPDKVREAVVVLSDYAEKWAADA